MHECALEKAEAPSKKGDMGFFVLIIFLIPFPRSLASVFWGWGTDLKGGEKRCRWGKKKSVPTHIILARRECLFVRMRSQQKRCIHLAQMIKVPLVEELGFH